MRLVLIVAMGLTAIAAVDSWRQSLSGPPPQPLVAPVAPQRTFTVHTPEAPGGAPLNGGFGGVSATNFNGNLSGVGGFCGGLGGLSAEGPPQDVEAILQSIRSPAPSGGTLGGAGAGPRPEVR